MSNKGGTKTGGAPRGGAQLGEKAAASRHQSGLLSSSLLSWEKLPKLVLGMSSGQFELWKRNAVAVLTVTYERVARAMVNGTAIVPSLREEDAPRFILTYISRMKDSFAEELR